MNPVFALITALYHVSQIKTYGPVAPCDGHKAQGLGDELVSYVAAVFNDVDLEGRIISLPKTHDPLSRDDWTGASLQTVLENELSPFCEGLGDRFRFTGPDIDLRPRYVLALGMTLHELTTNAAKYGALSAEDGHVDIAWHVTTSESGTRRMMMDWVETGGPTVVEPRRQGFGTRLINDGITHELRGMVRLTFEPPSLRCTLDLPLDAQDRFTSFKKDPATGLRMG